MNDKKQHFPWATKWWISATLGVAFRWCPPCHNLQYCWLFDDHNFGCHAVLSWGWRLSLTEKIHRGKIQRNFASVFTPELVLWVISFKIRVHSKPPCLKPLGNHGLIATLVPFILVQNTHPSSISQRVTNQSVENVEPRRFHPFWGKFPVFNSSCVQHEKLYSWQTSTHTWMKLRQFPVSEWKHAHVNVLHEYD